MTPIETIAVAHAAGQSEPIASDRRWLAPLLLGNQAARSRVVDVLVRLWRLAGLVAALVVGVELVALLWLIWGRAFQAPFSDEWAMIPLLREADRGTLSLANFWAFHNEHRIVIPRLTTFATLSLTDWDRRLMLTFNLVVVLATAGLLIDAARRTLGRAVPIAALTIPGALLLLSQTRYENWFQPITD